MQTAKEKEMLYSMLGDIIKERNELMKFIIKKIDALDNIEEDNRSQEYVRVDENADSNLDEDIASIVSDIPNSEEAVKAEASEVEATEEIVVEEHSNATPEVEAVVESSLEDVSKDKAVYKAVYNGLFSDVKGDSSKNREQVTDVEIEEKHEKSLEEIIKERNKSLGMEDAVVFNRQNTDIIPKSEIEKEKDKLPKRPSGANVDRVRGIIVNLLKESKKPVHIKELHSSINKRLKDNSEGEIRIENLRNNIMPRIMKSNKSIIRPLRGCYQYKK